MTEPTYESEINYIPGTEKEMLRQIQEALSKKDEEIKPSR